MLLGEALYNNDKSDDNTTNIFETIIFYFWHGVNDRLQIFPSLQY